VNEWMNDAKPLQGNIQQETQYRTKGFTQARTGVIETVPAVAPVGPSTAHLVASAAAALVGGYTQAAAALDNLLGRPQELAVVGIHAAGAHLMVAVLVRSWVVEQGDHVVAVVVAAAVVVVGVVGGLGMKPKVRGRRRAGRRGLVELRVMVRGDSFLLL